MRGNHMRDQGGPAFPVTANTANAGMSLRDWFAGQALAGLLAAEAGMMSDDAPRRPTFNDSAEAAYLQADAMLKARKGGLDELG